MKLKTGKSYTRGKPKEFRITTVTERHRVSEIERPVYKIEISGYNYLDESEKVWIEFEAADAPRLREIHDAIGAMLGVDGGPS